METIMNSEKKTMMFDYKDHVKNKTLCICKTLSPILTLIKFLGYFPINWKHERNRCRYEKSMFWLIYTGIVFVLQLGVILSNIDYMNLTNAKSLLVVLNNVTNAIYGHYIFIINIVIFFKYSLYIETLNKFISTLKSEIFCQSAMKRIVYVQYAIFASLFLVITFQIATYIWLICSDRYPDSINIINIVYRMLPNVSFCLYSLLFTLFGTLIATLACFEKYTVSCLRYVPVHPMKDIDDSNNISDFMGVIHYKICTETHPGNPKVMDLKPAEIVEYLRIYHEELSLCIYSWNKCMDPFFLLHTVVELGLLIIHWYAVIAYMVYSFKDPVAATIHILNYIYVIFHTYGLFLFLKNAQQLKNTVYGIVNFLLEYSTRVNNPDEHQQIRFFIEKIKNHRPFTASGVFTIDLGIAGPISANLLTYVLVALQFEIPKEQ